MARTGGMCGAVSGGILAISLILGRNTPTDPVDPCYQAVRRFVEQFTAQYGSVSCLELTGVHLGTPEGQAAFKEKDQITACNSYVSKAARIVLEVCEHR
jgi:C_GCAxxG_C_C family probable redox protein